MLDNGVTVVNSNSVMYNDKLTYFFKCFFLKNNLTIWDYTLHIHYCRCIQTLLAYLPTSYMNVSLNIIV